MIDGILNIYKEKGYTSHDVVAKLRGILRQKKIGHTGTLDPEAQGVLPVCLGRATKVCDMLTGYRKSYRSVLRLGIVTDTQDMTGQILSEAEVSCKEDEIISCIQGFTGRQQQIPPMYSALKVGGKKLYELARRGIEVERKARGIEIFSINIEEIRLPYVTMTVECSKGTYIRTLCHDIGQALGCGGCMESLLRIKVGTFAAEDSVKLAEVEKLYRENKLSEIVIPIDEVFQNLEPLMLNPEGERLVKNGNQINPSLCISECASQKGKQYRVYGTENQFMAVYEWSDKRQAYVPVKMFL